MGLIDASGSGWRMEAGGRGEGLEGAGRFTMTHRGGREERGVETFSDFPPKCEGLSAALVLDPVLLLSEVLVIQLSLNILAVLVHPGHLLHSEMFSAEGLKLGC